LHTYIHHVWWWWWCVRGLRPASMVTRRSRRLHSTPLHIATLVAILPQLTPTCPPLAAHSMPRCGPLFSPSIQPATSQPHHWHHHRYRFQILDPSELPRNIFDGSPIPSHHCIASVGSSTARVGPGHLSLPPPHRDKKSSCCD